jgi:hypothetical protein
MDVTMPADPESPTLAQVVTRAVEVCDDSSSDGLPKLLASFKGADEPVDAVDDVEQRLTDAIGPPEPDDDAALTMARALVCYLAHRGDQLAHDPVELLVLASRAEFGPNPPEQVARWLELQGIAV